MDPLEAVAAVPRLFIDQIEWLFDASVGVPGEAVSSKTARPRLGDILQHRFVSAINHKMLLHLKTIDRGSVSIAQASPLFASIRPITQADLAALPERGHGGVGR